MDRPTCATCPYWDEDALCRRYPPRVIVNPPEGDCESYQEAVWPLMEADEWCGEHPLMADWIAAQKEEPQG
jgi:hypothetical protein